MSCNPLPSWAREEFDRWAAAGRGEEMEEHHLPIVLPMLALIDFQPADKILDLGCGTGWLARLLARRLPQASVAGLDVSGEMVRRATRPNEGTANVTFLEGAAQQIPWPTGFFHKVVSVESAYYWPDPARCLREIFRVLAPNGSAWILINYYRDNIYCHPWGVLLAVPTHLFSADDWCQLMGDVGFGEVGHRRIPDESPTPEVYSGRWFRDADEMRRFKEEGALLAYGRKAAWAK